MWSVSQLGQLKVTRQMLRDQRTKLRGDVDDLNRQIDIMTETRDKIVSKINNINGVIGRMNQLHSDLSETGKGDNGPMS